MKDYEERYIHFVSCIRNLNNAWRILQEIKNSKKIPPAILNAAFRFAAIEYSKPYRDSLGKVSNSKGKNARYKLDEGFIPSSMLDLHTRILDARDKIHAHTDLSILDAEIYIESTVHGKYVSTSQNVIFDAEELSNIDLIIDLIEKTLDAMYEEERRLREELSLNT